MAEGLSEATANAVLAAILQQNAFVIDAVWIELHIGAPGADGTDNPAVETRRVDASECFGGTIAGGSTVNDEIIGPWTAVAASEDYSHYSAWTDDVGSGTFITSGTITAAAVTAGDDFSIPIGDLTFDFDVAA